jgi:hypothetical protein
MSVSSCALLFFYSSRADKIKKKKKKKKRIRRSKRVLVTLSGLRANDRWSMLPTFRILRYYICASSLFRYICLYYSCCFSLFVRMTSRSRRSSTSITIRSYYCLHTCSNTSPSYFCYCQFDEKNLRRQPYLYISLPASSNRRVYILLEN